MASTNDRKNTRKRAVRDRIALIPSTVFGASAVLVSRPSGASEFEVSELPDFCVHLNDVLRYAHDGQPAALANLIETSAAQLYELQRGHRPAYVPPLTAAGHIDVPRMSRAYINRGVRLGQSVRNELRTCSIEVACMRSLGVHVYRLQWTANLDRLCRDLNLLIDLAFADPRNENAKAFLDKLIDGTKRSAEWLHRVNRSGAAT